MRLSLEEARKIAERCKRVLEERFGVKVYIFGSVRGDTPFHEGSDIDIAVEGLPPEEFVRAHNAVEEVVPEGVKFDLVLLEEAPPELVAYVKGERKMPKEPKKALKQQVGDELRWIEGIVKAMEDLWAHLPTRPKFVGVIAAGKLLHDFSQHIERIFERICVWLEGEVPSGEEWHKRLLWHMAEEVEGVRPPVISPELARRIEELLKFRHKFRYTPGIELEWEKIEPLLREAPGVFDEFKGALTRFFSELEKG